nr:MAG: hypothetical protein AM324_05920 [Candidatus Thorarchaeota archaeon SMTZ1-83]
MMYDDVDKRKLCSKNRNGLSDKCTIVNMQGRRIDMDETGCLDAKNLRNFGRIMWSDTPI